MQADGRGGDDVAPRTVMRSAAPGPAPMKWTVMGSALRRRQRAGDAPVAMRGPSRRAPLPAAPRAAVSETDGVPACFSERGSG